MRNISWCPCLKVRVNFLPRRNYAAHFTVMVVAAFNKEKALVGAFSLFTNLRLDLRFKL